MRSLLSELGDSTPREQWLSAETDNEMRVRKALAEGFFAVEMGDGPVALAAISDNHIARGEPTDLKRMRADAELIAATPGMYAILGGDGIQNHIKHHAAIVNSRSTPGDQYKLYDHYLQMLGDKLLVVISGNHDNWTKQYSGVDMVQILAERNRLCYAPDRAYLTAQVGLVPYTFAIRHQYRFGSTVNATNTVKRWWDMGEVNFDIGVVCHEHDPAVEPFMRHGIERWAARPGSYQITSAHSRQYGYNITHPTCPTFVLYGDRRHIVGFNNLQDAAKFLTAERG